jgi:AraC family transcriptional regulator
VSVTTRALWYIESHLGGDLSLDAIAASVGVSRFHLSRAFAVTAGQPLAAYARARRLSEAAPQLAGGAPDILAVALDAGYGSHEAFTRAFRQHFGLTPEQLRERGCLDGLQRQEPLAMTRTASVTIAAPRLVRRDSLLIFGLGKNYTAQSTSEMAAQWNRFLPYFDSITNQVGHVAYGVICNGDEAGNYVYICGVEVTEFPADPPDYMRLRIPPQTYAVFDHRDHVSTIATTWMAIWERGLADAGHEATDGPAFERYGEQFDSRTGLGGVEIWVPIKG